MAQANRYRSASEELLRKARQALAEGDLIQASEKGWGAAAQAVKVVADRWGWPHQSHRDLYVAMRRLVGETGDQQLGDLFRGASALHMNSYENWMPAELVSGGLDQVENLVSKLEH